MIFPNWDVSNAVQIIYLIVLIFVFISALLSFYIIYLWIRYSLINRKNSLDMTGKDLTRKIFDNNGLSNVQVNKSIFYAKYWNYNKRKETYKLRNWTYNRKSVWTMMEATQQSYASVIRNSNKKRFWLAFRLPLVFGWLGISLAIFIIVWFAGFDNNRDQTDMWLWIFLAITIAFLSQVYALLARQYFLKKYAIELIKDIGFNEKELKIVQRIWVTLYYYAFIRAVIETLRLILQAIANSRK